MWMGIGMTSCSEAMGRGFWVIFEKKTPVGWDLRLDEASWDPNLGESSGVYKMRRAWWGQMEQSVL